MDISITLPSNASGRTFPGNTLSTYRVLLQKYMDLEGPHGCALAEITFPTKWYNVRKGVFYCLYGEDESPEEGKEHFDPRTTSMDHSQNGKRTQKMSKLKRALTSTREAEPPPPVLHPESTPRDEQEKADIESRESEENTQALTYIMRGEEGEPMAHFPSDLMEVEELAKKEFPYRRSYSQFSIDSGRVDDNQDLINTLNKLMSRHLRGVVDKLKKEKEQHGGPDQIFTYNPFTMKTLVSMPQDCMLIIPEYVSHQLGLEGKIYMGRRTKGKLITDVDYRNHTVYVYSDIIHNTIVGDTEAPMLRCMSVNNRSSRQVETVTFPNLIFHPVKQYHFREVTVYLRDSAGQPIPFEHGEVSVVLTFRALHPAP